ncbi:MAG TPA: VWA domain-containing protein [Terracidiphilus sp.]|jgi:VWFA-related protein|nr:VWA domain-containing protein [Terracidiphilus sp.]
MRKAILLGMLVLLAQLSWAARRVNESQLENVLAAGVAVHRTDMDAARQVGELEMTERLSQKALDHFAATFKLGPRTAIALQLLSDQSAFLDPPADEIPATSPPDAAEQQRMLATAQAYALQTWTRMPNFLVTRATHRFDDAPHVLAKGDWPVSAGLQLTGSSSRQVSFRDGKEIQEELQDTAAGKNHTEVGLRSWGEFGPALTVVLTDIANQKTAFSRWEQTPAGIAAVFRYEVPREASHYAVTFSYSTEQIVGRTQFGYSGHNRSPQQVANIPREMANTTYNETPPYHGTLAIDPATGAVLRITIEASLSSDDPLLHAATMIEYGPVSIGGREFICPIRSVAISREQAWMAAATSGENSQKGGSGDSVWQEPLSRAANQTVLLVNETTFTAYRRFGSTARILDPSEVDTSRNDASPLNGPSATGIAAVSASPQSGPSQSASAPASLSNPVSTEAATSSAPPSAVEPASPSVPPAAPTEAAIPEISMGPATSLPDSPAGQPNPESSYSLKVTSRSVDVGVVAFDKKGHPVADLNPADIEIYDDNRKQEIRSFRTAANPEAAPPSREPLPLQQPEAIFSNRAAGSVAPAPTASVSPTTSAGAAILLIDESHIAWADMSYARLQLLKFLGSLAPGERIGLYAMNGLGFRVVAEVTTDHQALIAAMRKFMPSAQSVAEAQDEETRNRQHFDEVHNAADLNSVNGNHIDVSDADQPIDPQLMTMGDDPTRSALVILAQVARHLAALPGQKKLVWVSSDNVFADWVDQAVGIEKSPKPMTSFVLRAQEAMNDAHTAIYPFDVSQLEGGAIAPDLQHQNVQLNQASADNAGLGGGTLASRNAGPGRIDAAMSQDIHPVQGPVRDVAAATGGRVIRRSGDLAAQLDGIVADERATYTVSFSPQGPADGMYHKIEVKLVGRRGVTLRYRTGYFFDKEPTTLRERFQRALWRPEDASEIAVTATASPQTGGANVKINIATADLGMEQRAGRWLDKLDIFFIQRDDAGIHAQVEGQTLGLRLKGETYQRLVPGGVPYAHSVLLKPGAASLRVLVVDENSGRMGSVTIPASTINGPS